MGKDKQLGICSICGENKELTFEHLPPRAAKNDRPVNIQDHRHLFLLSDENFHLYQKFSKSPKGLGGYKLCESCNTGGNYANDYAKLVDEAFPLVIMQRNNKSVQFSINIHPLNVLKQILIFHLCADQDLGALREIIQENNFILDRHQKELPPEIKVFMYATLSDKHRMFGIATGLFNFPGNVATYSEFNFHPFGFIVSLNSDPPLDSMMEITHFKDYNYNELSTINFELPLLNVINERMAFYL